MNSFKSVLLGIVGGLVVVIGNHIVPVIQNWHSKQDPLVEAFAVTRTDEELGKKVAISGLPPMVNPFRTNDERSANFLRGFMSIPFKVHYGPPPVDKKEKLSKN